MRLPKINRLAAVLVTMASYQSINAQQQITATEKNAAIQSIAKQIAANYIYPEKGGQIASHIQTVNFKGVFDKATTWKEFDELVTNELRQFSKDAHLYVKNDREIVKDLKGAAHTAEGQGHVSSESPEPVSMIQETKVLEGNIGYLKIPSINIKKSNVDDLYNAMRKMQGTKALIIDLRDNGGGGSDAGAVFESYFLPNGTPTLQFTTRDGNFTIDSTVSWLKEKKYENPVFILVNKKTASAAEAFAFVLQQKKRAKIVGESSAGAAYMNSWYAIDDENYVSVSTAVPSIPGTDISWELTGVQPDIKVKKGNALDVAIREAAKA
jgi:C-terminal processing protease CtpA/Prc